VLILIQNSHSIELKVFRNKTATIVSWRSKEIYRSRLMTGYCMNKVMLIPVVSNNSSLIVKVNIRKRLLAITIRRNRIAISFNSKLQIGWTIIKDKIDLTISTINLIINRIDLITKITSMIVNNIDLIVAKSKRRMSNRTKLKFYVILIKKGWRKS